MAVQLKPIEYRVYRYSREVELLKHCSHMHIGVAQNYYCKRLAAPGLDRDH